MIINLKFKERLMLPAIMPKEGNVMLMTIAEDISGKVKITQSEFEESGFTSDGSTISWKKDIAKDIDFTSAEVAELKKALKQLDTDNKITSDTLSLYHKFCDMTE